MSKARDINIRIDDTILNCRAVGLIRKENKILFQKRKQDAFWALPGGKIQVGEKSSDTLKREIEEEIGVNVNVKEPFSISEYFFKFSEDKYHQYIIAYNIEIVDENSILDEAEFDGIEIGENLIYK